jgi:hypothetical protein
MSAIVIAMRKGACSASAPDADENIANATNATVATHFDIANSCSRPRQVGPERFGARTAPQIA